MHTKTQLGVEQLDTRDMPSITLVGGVLTLDGTSNNDVASVAYFSGQIRAQLYSYAPGTSVGIGQTRNFSPTDVQKIVFHGYGGHDRFTNDTSLRSFAYGGAGSDVLKGGSNSDVFDGGGGSDQLHGNGGADLLYGNSGRDWLFGGIGNDTLWGGSEGDWLYGGSGLDHLDGGTGRDYLDGGVDGFADYLVDGNPEGDWFVPEKYTLGFGPVNRDEPQDATDPTDRILWP